VPSESSIIANTLSLDDVRVSEIMTPRTVVTTLRKNATVAKSSRVPNIPFAACRSARRISTTWSASCAAAILLKAKANDQDLETW